jgi:hypothetical protein
VKRESKRIESILIREVEECRDAIERARKAFSDLRVATLNWPLSPDEVMKIRNAAQDCCSTFNAYAIAVEEFSLFVLNGTIPARLKGLDASRQRRM